MVVCGDDVSGKTTGKPEPYIFLHAAREKLGKNVGDGEVNVSPEHALERGKGLVFEDAIPGVEAGKRAGMSGATFLVFRSTESRCGTDSSSSGMGSRPKLSGNGIFGEAFARPNAPFHRRIQARGMGSTPLRIVYEPASVEYKRCMLHYVQRTSDEDFNES